MKPTSNKEDNPKKDRNSKAKGPFRDFDNKAGRSPHAGKTKKEGRDIKKSGSGSGGNKFVGRSGKEGTFNASFNQEGNTFRASKRPYPGKKGKGDAAHKSYKELKEDRQGNKKGWDERGDKLKGAPSFQKKKGFRAFENDDLSFGKKDKMSELKTAEKPGDEVTFSKSIKKWEVEDVPPPYGRMEGRFEKKPDKRNKFRQKFDEEHPQEKVYSRQGGSARKSEEGHFSERSLEGEMPLNKYIAHCGVCSRRDAVTLIKEGKVKVNGELVDEPGYKVTLKDQVTLSGKKISIQKNLVYILLNKPQGYITTTDDPKGRSTVLDIFKDEVEERIFPVGRLDRNTTGLLLLTNDGELTQKLSHPKYEVRKVYKVTLNKNVSIEDFNKIKEGIVLEDGPAPVDQIEYLDKKSEIGLEIHSGKNRIVRRIFESLGYVVERLDRVMYAGLTKKNLPRGKWRFLSKQEVINLKYLK